MKKAMWLTLWFISATGPRALGSGAVFAEGAGTNVSIQLGEAADALPSSTSSRSGQKITGVVLDPGGKPAARVLVSLSPYLSYAQKKTDESGRFVMTIEGNRLGGPDSQLVLIARDPERNLAAAMDLEEDATNTTVRLAPASTLAGQATDSSGKPVANAQGRLLFRTDRMSAPLGQAVRADEEGKFEIKGLPAGRRFIVTVTARGYGQDSHEVETAESESRRVNLEPFQLEAAHQRIAGVVLDADDKPVRSAWLYCYGDKQPPQNSQSDAQGHFSFDKVCAGTIRISANSQSGGFASTQAEAGDTNITINLGNSGIRRAVAPQSVALRGKPFPDLAATGLTAADAPVGQAILTLVMDAEQRPCRRLLSLLGDQATALKQKGVTVVVLQSGDMAEDAFTAWRQGAATPFAVGRLKLESEKARAAWGAVALPWLILTDKAHRVIAEGFGLDDLDAKIGDIK